MSIPFWEREKYIKMLFDYEEENNIPANERLTFDAYADSPEIPEVSPRKKGSVDIRTVIFLVKDLIGLGRIKNR
jgi:hypothetical protein